MTKEDIQTEFIKAMTNFKENTDQSIEKEERMNRIDIINKFISKMDYTYITNEVLYKIDLNVVNIYIEYVVKELLNKNFTNINNMNVDHNKLYIFVSYYHPKLYEYIFYNKDIKNYNIIRESLLKTYNEIYKEHYIRLNEENKKRMTTLKNILQIAPNEDISKITAFEYCYFLTWAVYNRNFVDVSKEYIMSNNNNDILTINATYNLKYTDSIVMYNIIPEIYVPILTDDTIEKTQRYKEAKVTQIATEPVSIYNKDFKKIDKLKTSEVTVLIDYGNGFYTKLYNSYDYREISLNFALNIKNRKIIPTNDRRLMIDTINKDIYDFLPKECYVDKEKYENISKQQIEMKKLVNRCYNLNLNKTIENIKNDKELYTILNKKEKPIFEYYLEYLKTVENVDMLFIINHCCEYLYQENAI